MAIGVGVDGVGIAGVEDGWMESLQASDDVATGAPLGVPSAIVLDMASVGMVEENAEGQRRGAFWEGRMGVLSDSSSTPRAGPMSTVVPCSLLCAHSLYLIKLNNYST